MFKYKLWLLRHDKQFSIHVTEADKFKQDVEKWFPNADEIKELKASCKENTFKLHLRAEINIHPS